MKRSMNTGLLVIRLSIGIMMLLHGIAKLKGIGGIGDMLKAHGYSEYLAYGVYVGEIIAPLLIIVGYRTRVASLVFAFNMLVAILLTQGLNLFAMKEMGGLSAELPLLFLTGALALFFTGGGRYALSMRSIWD